MDRRRDVGPEAILVRIDDRYGSTTDFLAVHNRAQCEGRDYNCCIHNPSIHSLWRAPLIWRSDIRIMERMCKHGIGHPDPDDLNYKKLTMPDYDNYQFGIHSCDGCCINEVQ